MTTDAVISALEAQVSEYRKLAKLAELQHAHVQQNQTDQLLEVLKSRESVLRSIARLEREVAPAKKKWGDCAEQMTPERRKLAESLLAETRKLLEQITTADQNDALVLQHRKLGLGKQINQATAARQVNRNYAAGAYGATRSQMDVQR